MSGERDDPAGRETAVVSRFGKPAIWSGMIALAHTACLLVAMNWAQASRLSDLSKEGLMSYLSRAFLLGLIIFAVSLLIIVMWRSRFMSRRAFGWVSLLVAATGCIIGALMVDIAIDHNPQGAFIDLDSGAVNYVSLSLIFYTWFLLFFLCAEVPALLCCLAYGCYLSRRDEALNVPGAHDVLE